MKKYYLINYCAEGAGDNAVKELADKLQKNFDTCVKLEQCESTFLVSTTDMSISVGDVWLMAYTKGVWVVPMKVSETKASNLR